MYGIYRKKPLYLLPNLLKWMTIHAAIILPFIVLTSFRLFGILSFVEQSRYMPYPEEKGLAFIWVFITQMPSGNFWLIWISCVFLYCKYNSEFNSKNKKKVNSPKQFQCVLGLSHPSYFHSSWQWKRNRRKMRLNCQRPQPQDSVIWIQSN